MLKLKHTLYQTLAAGGTALALVTSLVLWDINYTWAKPGRVLGAKATKDIDKDGLTDDRDKDDDNDGWPDALDPMPGSVYDPDNDGLPNSRDKDDDGDGKVDTKDYVLNSEGQRIDLSLDQNNNKKRDEEERMVSGRTFDGDGDQRSDLTEMLNVIKTQASALGRPIASLRTFNDVPSDIIRRLPDRWWNITHDRDNDGIPSGLDSNEKTKVADAYQAYRLGGHWENIYRQYDNKGDQYGFVPPCLACAGTERTLGAPSSVKRYSPPTYGSAGGYRLTGSDYVGSGGASAHAKYNKDFFAKQGTKGYRSLPQFQGGSYVKASGTATGSGVGGAQSGGSWLSGGSSGGAGGGGASGGGGDGGSITGGGGGGGTTGSSGSSGSSGSTGSGGAGGCSKC